jgi:orotidine-5'-phosphate decarboxylase
VAPKLCLALDSRVEDEILTLADATAEHVDVFKVGLTAFNTFGPKLVERLARIRPVFLDLKLHDIPVQVAGAIEAVAASGATYTTVHCFGGREMLAAAVESAPAELTVLGVTVLTSLDDSDLDPLGLSEGAEKTVLRLADLALSCEVPGLVCSPQEVNALRERFGPTPKGPLLVVPGIRPAHTTADDQRRTLGPAEAVAAGADLLVVGRPITASADPRSAARAIKEEMLERS